MKLLLDTHVLLWAAVKPHLLAPEHLSVIQDQRNTVVFSVVSLWEIAIKQAKHGDRFPYEAESVRGYLLAAAYQELNVQAEHVLSVLKLPAIHGDPFDRLLIAQAQVENCTLLTVDRCVAQYPINRH